MHTRTRTRTRTHAHMHACMHRTMCALISPAPCCSESAVSSTLVRVEPQSSMEVKSILQYFRAEPIGNNFIEKCIQCIIIIVSMSFGYKKLSSKKESADCYPPTSCNLYTHTLIGLFTFFWCLGRKLFLFPDFMNNLKRLKLHFTSSESGLECVSYKAIVIVICSRYIGCSVYFWCVLIASFKNIHICPGYCPGKL